MTGRILIVVTVLFFGFRTAAAQSLPDNPRIGLVLSGGGGRGFAHLGVLKVLHEMRIPVHVIAGTSMGAVVGGIYAMGLPYPELEAMFQNEDWVALFEDDPPRRQWPMRRKRADQQLALEFEVGISRDGFRLPPALVIGSKLNNALWAYTFPASDIESFDVLPIPFRAVATDVADGSMVVLDRGSLAAAIRASMAVPGAFSPEVIGDRRLVDGGMVRNVPIDVARQMGVDVLIVSDVSTSPDDAPSGEDPISLAMRLITVITWGTSQAAIQSLTESDIIVRPVLGDMSAADFSGLDDALAAGEAVAREAADRLAAYSVPVETYATLVEERARALPDNPVVTPSLIRVDGSETALRTDVVEALLEVEAGDSIAMADLRRNLTRIYGYGGFEGAEFRVIDEPGQQDILEVKPRDKSWGPIVMRAGLTLHDRQVGAGGWSLRGRLEHARPMARGGEAWAEVELGTRHGFRARLQVPLVPSDAWFAIAYGTLGRRESTPRSEEVEIPIEAEVTDRQLALGLGRRLGSWGEATGWVSLGQYDLELPTEIDGEVPQVRADERSLGVSLDADVLDRVAFPSSGHTLNLSYRQGGTWLGGDPAFKHLFAEAFVALSSGHQTVSFTGLVSTGLGTQVPLPLAPSLAGLDRITGAPRDAMWGGQAVMAKLGWAYRLGLPASDPTGGGIHFGLTAEGGRAWDAPDAVDLTLDEIRFGGSVWAGRDTPLGPIRLAWAKVKAERASWVIQVGLMQ